MKRLNIDDFITRARKVHGSLYDYSRAFYIRNKVKTIITCKKHGDFIQSPNAHLDGQGCPKCKKCYRPSTEEFIAAATKIHRGKYFYTNTKYLTSLKKVIITCKQHGDYYQYPSLHLSGQGCPKCAPNFRKTLAYFVGRSKEIHNNFYDYSSTDYEKSNKKVSIICPKHGKFFQTPSMHLYGNGCPKCKNSKGEIAIAKWLKTNNFLSKHQKTFDQCRNPKTNCVLKFDFYLPLENVLIEYDGEQHFRSGRLVGGKHITTLSEYQDIHRKDKIKNKFAKSNNIKIIRIPYTKFSNINEILTQNLLCPK